MDNRRLYERVELGIEGTFYLKQDDHTEEFSGSIRNISENGIGVVLDPAVYESICEKIAIGNHIRFQALDEKGFSISEEVGIFQGSAEVVRSVVKNDGLEIGCKVSLQETEFQEYVKNKKVLLFFETMKER